MELAVITLIALACSTVMSILAFMIGRCGRKLPIDGMLPRVVCSARFSPEAGGPRPAPEPATLSWPFADKTSVIADQVRNVLPWVIESRHDWGEMSELPAVLFGSLLRSLRAAAGLTQEELAEAARVSYRTVSDLERGVSRSPHRDTARLLADALGLSGDELARFEDVARGRPSATGTVAPGAPPKGIAAARTVPRQLPAHTAHFVGRADELAALAGLLDKAAGPSRLAAGTTMIAAIGGTAGIGKTELAVRWAHQVTGRFPDGHLYVNLRGFDPAAPPVRPAEVIRDFLGALGVDPSGIPVSLDAQAALYRSLLAGRRFLLLLDNARDAEQVRPLLPGTETCLVLVTSRSQLSSLAAREGAQLLTPGLLAVTEARELLTRHLGPSRAAPESEVVDELIELCARLPLALSIVAARAAAAPSLPLAGLAGELRDERLRLDALDAGDLATNMQAVFSCSYGHLSKPAARMFRMLGLHPGPDVSAAAAASLAGVPLMRARKALTELTRAYLVTEHAPGRFTFHDLLRVYAARQGINVDTETERHAAVWRVLDHYLHTGLAAIEWLYPDRAVISLIAPDPPIITTEELTSREQSRAWCEAEQKVLPAIVTLAASGGFDTHAWQIPWVLTAYFNRQGYLHEWTAALHTALVAARRAGDRHGQALAIHELGYAYLRLGIYDKARVHLRHALDLNRELGDRAEQAHNHIELAEVENYQGHPDEALSHARQSFDLYLATGHRTGQARARTREGRCLTLHGEYQQALACSLAAITIQRELVDKEDKYVTAETLKALGDTHHHLGNYPQAIDYHRQSLELNRHLGDHYAEAETLARLGDAYEAAAELDAAQDAWQQAAAILRDLHHPDAALVLAKLSKLPPR